MFLVIAFYNQDWLGSIETVRVLAVFLGKNIKFKIQGGVTLQKGITLQPMRVSPK